MSGSRPTYGQVVGAAFQSWKRAPWFLALHTLLVGLLASAPDLAFRVLEVDTFQGYVVFSVFALAFTLLVAGPPLMGIWDTVLRLHRDDVTIGADIWQRYVDLWRIAGGLGLLMLAVAAFSFAAGGLLWGILKLTDPSGEAILGWHETLPGLGLIGGLLLASPFALTPLLVLDGGRGPLDAFRISLHRLRPYLGLTMGIAATGIGLIFVGILTLGVGFLFTTPFTLAMWAALYDRV